MSRRTESVILLVILVVAFWIRVWGIRWGLPHPYHPDEGTILFHAMGFGTGDLNPHWFRWPSLLMYVMFGVYGVYYVVGRIVGTFGAPVDLLRHYLTDPTPFWLMGRALSILAGTATVWVTYRIGKRAFGAASGLAAAAFLAVMFLHVRDSHYATPDVATTLLASCSLLFALRAYGTGAMRDIVLSGFFAGLATSAKYPGGLAGIAVLVAVGLLVRERRTGGVVIVTAVLAGAVGFLLGTPYAVVSGAEFLRDISTQVTMVSQVGVGQAPASFWSGLREVAVESLGRGVGYPVLALAVLGAVWPFARWRRGAKTADASRKIAVAYVAVFLVVMSLLTVKRSTYLTPALTGIALLAAGGLSGLARLSTPRRSQSWNPAWVAIAAVVVLASGWPAVRFCTALGVPDTRTEAKVWFESHVEPGSRVAVETYGPPLNMTSAQLGALLTYDTTRVSSWEESQRLLNEMRLDVLGNRAPQYEIYGIGWGEGPFELPAATERPDELAATVDSLGIRYVVVSSKAAPTRLMKGAAPPRVPVDDPFYRSLATIGSRVALFASPQPMWVIDRGPGRSFHSPVIEIYELPVVEDGAEATASAGDARAEAR